MPSLALERWTTTRCAALDELVHAHDAVIGARPGLDLATQQILQAFTVLLSSQFQAFCRDFHDECVEAFIPPMLEAKWQAAIRTAFTLGRKLDKGNPNRSTIQQDFGRFEIQLLDMVKALDPGYSVRLVELDSLMLWRNAISHQNFRDSGLDPTDLSLALVVGWRDACNGLAIGFDALLFDHIQTTVGRAPW